MAEPPTDKELTEIRQGLENLKNAGMDWDWHARRDASFLATIDARDARIEALERLVEAKDRLVGAALEEVLAIGTRPGTRVARFKTAAQGKLTAALALTEAKE